MKTYKLFIRYWDGLKVDIIKTDDIYHYIGKLYCTSIEKIERVDYKELIDEKYCIPMDDICKVCSMKYQCLSIERAKTYVGLLSPIKENQLGNGDYYTYNPRTLFFSLFVKMSSGEYWSINIPLQYIKEGEESVLNAIVEYHPINEDIVRAVKSLIEAINK